MSAEKTPDEKSQYQQKQIVKKDINKKKTNSCPDLQSVKLFNKLKRSRSETDIKNTTIKPKSSYIAKSERNLNILYHHSTPTTSPSDNIHNMDISNYTTLSDEDAIKIPIIGYEVMEERSRFTIFKLRIENYEKNNFYLVLRRFTDFTRLYTKLRQSFPHINLFLPKKKWFGNNFSAGFLDSRINGLQTFINIILSNKELRNSSIVREFFCLDEPPLYSESIEECKIIFEAQEETIAHLKMQIKAKDEMIANLTQILNIERQQNEYLKSLLKSSIEKCSKTDSLY
ncbi:hypothetical protein PVAND_008350 [Polypedilum vanderplanki]|uniref:PX domain-containing protein n=1 Tax=Polypedilum vanderplanki TaxID=319348 RepID=A0A9J6CAS2_POLVA|nr:hypothetical protein PVAND_008350 [Polypedilum vanderplanki]